MFEIGLLSVAAIIVFGGGHRLSLLSGAFKLYAVRQALLVGILVSRLVFCYYLGAWCVYDMGPFSATAAAYHGIVSFIVDKPWHTPSGKCLNKACEEHRSEWQHKPDYKPHYETF